MTISEQYAAWLANAMRSAGLDIDRQRGGGRKALAEAIGVSGSTVARWLDAKAVPSPEYFEPIADTVGVPVVNMLIESGIISAESVTPQTHTGVRSQPITPAQAADELGLTDPVERARFMRDLARRNRRHLRIAEDEGEAGGAVAH
ncbi:helix-turn-helix domain-containing protein [Kitasatospora camelliae]|uniref:Helix-turn-helix transcriptional regulator n=1 Tax=Kitasatospora camelliae TaxID=3156397 RepID=A0AAU8K6B8_9ACTN